MIFWKLQKVVIIEIIVNSEKSMWKKIMCMKKCNIYLVGLMDLYFQLGVSWKEEEKEKEAQENKDGR